MWYDNQMEQTTEETRGQVDQLGGGTSYWKSGPFKYA